VKTSREAMENVTSQADRASERDTDTRLMDLQAEVEEAMRYCKRSVPRSLRVLALRQKSDGQRDGGSSSSRSSKRNFLG